jgi:hypothetical protein
MLYSGNSLLAPLAEGRELFKEGESMQAGSMSEAVRMLFENYYFDYEFGTWDLKRDVNRLYPPAKKMHGDTVTRRLREFRHGKDYEIVCTNPCKSRYRKIKRVPEKRA